MSDPLVHTAWSRPEAWARADRIHSLDCSCRACRRDRVRSPGPADRASAWSTWALAGVAFGNLLAFAWDARGAFHALAAAFGAGR